MVVATTLEPFLCMTKMTINTKPKLISRCQNIKLIAYLNEKDQFVDLTMKHLNWFAATSNTVSRHRQWYEFQLGR